MDATLRRRTADLRNHPEHRQALREAVDERTRERLAKPPARKHCNKCGCSTDQRTPGCRTCKGRHVGRQKRAAA